MKDQIIAVILQGGHVVTVAQVLAWREANPELAVVWLDECEVAYMHHDAMPPPVFEFHNTECVVELRAPPTKQNHPPRSFGNIGKGGKRPRWQS